MAQDANNSSPGRNDCAICYSKAVYPTLVPCCNNRFCFLCIKGVFIRHGSCPLCRAPLDAELFDHPSFSQGIDNDVPPSDSQGEDSLLGTLPVKEEEEDQDDAGPSTQADSDAGTSQLPSDVKPTQAELAALVPSLPSTLATQDATQVLPTASSSSTQDSNATQALPDVNPPTTIASALAQFAAPAAPGSSTSRNNRSSPNGSRSNRTRSGVEWFYSGRRGGWWRYDPTTERHIERAYDADSDGCHTVWISGYQYDIDFSTMQQIRMDSGVRGASRRIKRVLPEELYRFHNSIKGIAGIYYPRSGAH